MVLLSKKDKATQEATKHKLNTRRKKLRANVEVTIKEVKIRVKNGKVRIRGQKRINFIYATAIAVNLIRIYKYLYINIVKLFFL